MSSCPQGSIYWHNLSVAVGPNVLVQPHSGFLGMLDRQDVAGTRPTLSIQRIAGCLSSKAAVLALIRLLSSNPLHYL